MNLFSPNPVDFFRSIAPKRGHSVLVAVLAVGGLFAVVAGALALWPGDGGASMDPSAPPSVSALSQPPQRLRCETCGVIEGIRKVEATSAVPGSYEFAVRLPDGSLRHSSDPSPGRWQVGDHMQLIGGDRTWSNSP